MGKYCRIRKNTNIWEPEDPADKVYFAEFGRLKIIRLNSDGSEILLETVKTAEFFGESCFIANEKRKTIATALCDCSIWEFAVRDFFKLTQNNSDFLKHFISSVSKKKRAAENRIITLSHRKIEDRLSQTLFDLASESGIRTGSPPSSKMKIFVTHEELAELTAASRQRITKTMNHFREIGLVEYDRTEPLVIDLTALGKHLEKAD